MQRQRIDGALPRSVLIGLITHDAVIGRIAPHWKQPGLFDAEFMNLIGGWCVQHFLKFDRAPGKSIESYFHEWAEKHEDDERYEAVGRLLRSLSGQHEQTAKEVNPDHLVDLAGTLFTQTHLLRQVDGVKADIERGELARALERWNATHPLNLGEQAWIDPFRDLDSIDEVFDSPSQPIVEYKGGLGLFIDNTLEREGFVGIMGSAKRGKCVAGDQEVMLADGSVSRIVDLVKRGKPVKAVTLDEATGKFTSKVISQFWDSGRKECFRVTTKSGRTVTTTADHKYLTPRGWVTLRNVEPGDFIAGAKQLPYFGREPMGEAKVKFLAYMLADGCCVMYSQSFTKTDESMTSDFHATCKSLGVGYRRKGITTYLRGAGALIRSLGIWWKKSTEKTIPPELFRCPKEEVATFLRVFFSCDGCVYRDRGKLKIELTLANERLLRQVSHLLTRFGVVHSLFYSPATCEGKTFPAWRLLIQSQEYVRLFLREINLLSYKHTEPETSEVPSRSFLDRIPCEVADSLYREVLGRGEVTSAFGNKASHLRQRIKKRQHLTRQAFAGSASRLVASVLKSDVLWDEVVSVESVGDMDTYDIGVEEHHNFVCNDTVVHNSHWAQEFGWQAMTQRRKVGYIEIGDMTRRQFMNRMIRRAAMRPLGVGRLLFPDILDVEKGKGVVHHKIYEYGEAMTKEEGRAVMEKIAGRMDDECRFRLSIHPNFSITILEVYAIVKRWVREGWCPDVLIIDYPDNLAPVNAKESARDQINTTWRHMRRINQELHCLLITPTQADAQSYKAELLRREHFTDDRRKFDHVTAMLGVNMTDTEKEQGLYRLNWLQRREGDWTETRVCHTAGSLAISAPAILSRFPWGER